jgi:tetratricopeptide (TPR) repeat protein
MQQLSAGNYAAAAGQFEQVLKLDPGHDRARLELGRSYYSLGRFEEAREAFLTVLRHNPPDTVKINVQLFLDRIALETRKFDYNLRIAVGVFYDDNVNIGPASDLIRIRPTSFGGVTLDTLTVAEETQPAESWGLSGEASAYAQYDAGARGGWYAMGGVDYYQTWLEDFTDREIFYGDIFAGAVHMSPKTIVNVPLRYAHIDQGHEELVDIAGVAPSYNAACSSDTLCSLGGVAEMRDYADFDDRDSFYGELRGQTTRLFDQRSKSITAAIGAFYEDADNDVNSNSGAVGSLGGSVSLPLNIRIDVKGSYRASWYDEREPLAPETRDDDEWQGLAQVSRAINEHWTLSLMYQYTTRDSSFDLYDYDRNFTTLRAQCYY